MTKQNEWTDEDCVLVEVYKTGVSYQSSSIEDSSMNEIKLGRFIFSFQFCC